MPTYISLLRGINLGGNKVVPMVELRALFEGLGFRGVRTYIQSGNVVFRGAKGNPRSISEKIERKITAKFGFSASVITRTEEELARAIANNPFLKESRKDPAKVHVCFLSETAPAEAVKRLEALGTKAEQVKCAGREAYVYHADGLGKARVLTHGVLERVLTVKVTMRNWNTSSKLREMAAEKS